MILISTNDSVIPLTYVPVQIGDEFDTVRIGRLCNSSDQEINFLRRNTIPQNLSFDIKYFGHFK